MWKRIANLFRALLGSALSAGERQNPQAVLEVEQQQLKARMDKFNHGLAAHAAVCERMMGQVKQLEAEEQDLRTRAAANLKSGSREMAGKQALRLRQVTGELAALRQQLEEAEATYRDLLKAREMALEDARAKIGQLKRSIADLKTQKALADVSEMAAEMLSPTAQSGDTLQRLHEMVEEDRALAAGRARLAHDTLNTVEFRMREVEQRALEDEALAEFAAREGLPAPGALSPGAAPPGPDALSSGGSSPGESSPGAGSAADELPDTARTAVKAPPSSSTGS